MAGLLRAYESTRIQIKNVYESLFRGGDFRSCQSIKQRSWPSG